MKKIIVAIPHSHTWLWTQTCISSLLRNPPKTDGYFVEVVIVDNSPWSPAIWGITRTDLMRQYVQKCGRIRTYNNYKSNKFHASALDCIVEQFEFDYLMALETDVLLLKPNWLEWFLDQMRETDYAVGMWHHENFVNPSCTLYKAKALYEMREWCENYAPQEELRWGDNFSLSAPLDKNLTAGVLSDPRDLQAAIDGFKSWVCGPFAEKRGFPEGTVLKESPSGQLKGPGWYEPGQQLHHWATNQGYSYTVCPTLTTKREDGLPLQTLYTNSDTTPATQLEANNMFASGAYTAHLWGGTRALDILKHEVTCGFVKANTPMWLAREARFWKKVVPPEVQKQTLELIRQHGFHITGQGSDHVSDRDKEAAEYVKQCYKEGGVEI